MLDTVEMMVTYLTMSCLTRTTARQPTLIEHGNKHEILARNCLSLNPVLVGQYLVAQRRLLFILVLIAAFPMVLDSISG